LTVMTERKIEIIVGLFVSLAVIGLILGVVWGKNFQFFSKRQHLTLLFDDVRGLQAGDPVVVRGLQKGEVESIHLKNRNVEVRIWFEPDVRLYTDFRAVIEIKELMGGKQVVLYPGQSGKQPDYSDLYRGEVQADFNSLFSQADLLFTELDSMLNETRNLLTGPKIENILNQIEMTSKQMRSLISEIRPTLASGVERFESISEQFQSDSAAAKIDGLISKLDSAAYTFHKIGLQIQDKEGTLGQLVGDKKLYDDLIRTTGRLDSLIVDIKKNPGKYIHVSVF
jgi:phospholipid/cholesterol/gamma-HCH transport system substrate-binding protein